MIIISWLRSFGIKTNVVVASSDSRNFQSNSLSRLLQTMSDALEQFVTMDLSATIHLSP